MALISYIQVRYSIYLWTGYEGDSKFMVSRVWTMTRREAEGYSSRRGKP